MWRGLVCFVVLFAVSSNVMAVPYIGATALPAIQTITFDPSALLQTDPIAGNFPPVTFTNWFFSSDSTLTNGTGIETSNYISNHNLTGVLNFPTAAIASSFTFASATTSASFEFFNFSSATINAYLGGTGGTLVDTQVVSPFTLQFVGFQGVTFDTIEVLTAANGSGSDAYLDNLGFGNPAPEITESSMMAPLTLCLGILLTASGRRRRPLVSEARP